MSTRTLVDRHSPGARRAWLVCSAVLLGGCLNSILPKDSNRAVYGLVDPGAAAAPDCSAGSGKSPVLPAGLMVETPQALAPLNGTDVNVLRSDGEIQMLPGARWAAPIPGLLQDLLARTAEQRCVAPVVAQSAQASALPLRVASDLRSFGLVERNGDLHAQVSLSVRLICSADARVIAAHQLNAEAPAGTGALAGVVAVRGAAQSVATQWADWLSQLPDVGCAFGVDSAAHPRPRP